MDEQNPKVIELCVIAMLFLFFLCVSYLCSIYLRYDEEFEALRTDNAIPAFRLTRVGSMNGTARNSEPVHLPNRNNSRQYENNPTTPGKENSDLPPPTYEECMKSG